MTIEKWDDLKGGVTLCLGGRIDTNNSGQLRQAVADVPLSARLTLDFRNVPYISSSGLRELLVCRKRFPDEHLKLVNVAPEVMDIFETTGFSDMLPIETGGADLSTYISLSFKALLARRVGDMGDRTALKCARADYTWRDIDRASQIIANDLSAVEIGRVCAIGDVDVLCCGEIPAMVNAVDFYDAVRSAEGCRVREFYSIRNSVDYSRRFGECEALRGKFEQAVDADAPCVVIFTSGSTGRPKGVILSAYNLLNASAVQARMQRVTDADRNLVIVPLFHILGLAVCLLPCAMLGAALVIPDDIRTGTLIRVMAKERCTLMHSVPTMILALLNNPDFDPAAFSCLRCTCLAGASATEAQLRLFRQRLPNDHFVIAYGLSEMAPVSQTLYDDTDDHILRTVGKPVENIRIRIVDRETGLDCPIGAPGEIWVQGFNLMTGYYKLPLKDQAIDGESWLHTGDMGALDVEGYLTLLGRYKELIIRGGENIMPGEVEAAVAALPGVDEVKVVSVPSDFFGEEVAACVRLSEGAEWDEDAARGTLKATLAKYKLPRWFILCECFPTLANGKIDVAALKAEAIRRVMELSKMR